jgi:hypothetical protein
VDGTDQGDQWMPLPPGTCPVPSRAGQSAHVVGPCIQTALHCGHGDGRGGVAKAY